MRRLGYSHRPATEEDLSQVAQIEVAAIRPPWSREAFAAEIGKAHHHFWVITDDETDCQVLAYAVFSFPAEQAHIQTIAVRPESLRQGIGRHLLRQIIAFVMRKKGESVILELRQSNQAALKLYQSLGFVVIRSLPKLYPDGEDAFVMVYKTDPRRISDEQEADFEAEDGHDGKQNLN